MSRLSHLVFSEANDLQRGCTTPKQISNLRDEMEGDEDNYDLLDGYDELPSELQEKVRVALKQGHVTDEDWKGVS